MCKKDLFVFFLLFFITLSAFGEIDTKGWFVFDNKDDLTPSVIDMSDWLDTPSGKHGFVKIKKDMFVFEDDTPVKFWGVNICSGLPYVENDKAEQWVTYLAKYGVNAVRFHKFTRPALTGLVSTQPDSSMFDRFDYFQAKLREKGIYYGWSHIYGHKPKPGDRHRLLNYDEIANFKVPWAHLNGATSGLVNFAEDLQDLNIELTVNMLIHRNPYTGLRYADDPALNFIELQNEDNIFWGAIEKTLDQTPTYRALLNKKFCGWLRNKYGTNEALQRVWGANAFEPGEHLDKNNIYPKPNHGLFDWEYEQARKEDRPVRQVFLDRAEFLFDEQIGFYNRFVKAIRETGYKGPVVGSCWQAGSGITHFYNLYADFLTGFIDRHNYFGGGTGHQLKPGPVKNRALVSKPGSGLLSAGMQNVVDRPFAFSEWMSLVPNEWTAEAAPLIAVYGMGLQGWDASYAFASNNPGITSTVQAHNHGVYNADSPLHIALYPALARMIYRRDVKQGEVVACRNLSHAELKTGSIGFRQTVVQDYDEKSFSGDVPSEALAAGRVLIGFTEKPEQQQLSGLDPLWDRDGKIIRSPTKQLTWNYENNGYFTVNTPGTKGLVGFSEGQELDLDNVRITVKTQFAVVLVTSLDKEQPIETAKSLLVTTVARARNTGMRYDENKSQLLDIGKAPVLMEPVKVDLRIDRPGQPDVYVLDPTGKRTGEKIKQTGDTIKLDSGLYKTIYYEINYSAGEK